MKRDAGNLAGQTFGRLTVRLFYGHDERGSKIWLCDCRCGNITTKTTSQIRDKSNPNPSCGCANKESIAKASAMAWDVTTKFRHPHKLKLKWLFRNMVNRCHNPKSSSFDRYGAKGISVCQEWRLNPTAFYEWAVSHGYAPGLEIERKDFRGNYCPENCTFTDDVGQANNTSKNVFLEANGKRLTMAQWSRELGLSYSTIQHRRDRGLSVEEILRV